MCEQRKHHGPDRSPARRSAFTLVEMLIVVAIIALLATAAVPAYRFMTRANSLAAGQNILASMVSQARSLAMGRQRPAGVFFFYDPMADRDKVAIVQQTTYYVKSGSNTVYCYDLVDDVPTETLPAGLGVRGQMAAYYNAGSGNVWYVPNAKTVSGVTTNVEYGGMILFDLNGEPLNSFYGFHCYDSVNKMPTAMGNLLLSSGWKDFYPTGTPRSQIGCAVFEREGFLSQTSATAQDSWIRSTADVNHPVRPLVVSRYSGLLIRGD